MHITLQQLTDWLSLNDIQSSVESETVLTGVSTDTRTLERGNLYVPLIGERFDGHDFITQAIKAGAGAVLCQQDRKIPAARCPVYTVPDTLEALQRLAREYRRFLNIPVIAVTGSNGKTTTKDFIAAVLSVKYNVHKTKGNFNNHIGLPLSLLAMPEATEIAVLEMGMNHEGEIALLSGIAEPDTAVITNIGDAHIAYFGSKQGIAKAKLEIVLGLKTDGVLFINGDDTLLCEEANRSWNNVQKVGLGNDVDERATDVKTAGPNMTHFTVGAGKIKYELPMLGKHNVTNALLAIAVGRHMGLSDAEMAMGLKAAQLSGGRLQMRETDRGMWVIDDSYNANPTAVKAGVQTLIELKGKSRKWVLLGDILELGEQEEQLHRDIGHFVSRKDIEYVFTIGKRGYWIHEAAAEGKDDPAAVVHFETVDEAIEELLRRDNGETVLLVKASRDMALERVANALCESPSLTDSERG